MASFLTHFRSLGQKSKNNFVQFLVQMRTREFAIEINWPLVQWRVEALMSNLEYDHPVIVRGFIIKTYDGAPSTGHDSFLLNSYALHLNYLKYHRILSNNQEGVCPSLQHTFSITTMDWNSFWITILNLYKKAAKSHS